MLILFPLYKKRAFYVNTDKRNAIHTSIQIQRIKLKKGVCLEVPKFAKEKFKIKSEICLTKFQKTHCCLKLSTVTFENDMPMISAAIRHCMHCHSALPYTGEGSKQQTIGESDKILSKKKISVGRKRILKNTPLFFFGVNVNVLERTCLQAL